MIEIHGFERDNMSHDFQLQDWFDYEGTIVAGRPLTAAPRSIAYESVACRNSFHLALLLALLFHLKGLHVSLDVHI